MAASPTIYGQVMLTSGSRVFPAPDDAKLHIDESWLGRVVNGLGEPLDEMGKLSGRDPLPTELPSVNPLKRKPVSEPLDVGVRAINAMLTLGKGQRVGLFAGSGVGKSVLLGMMCRNTNADVIVTGRRTRSPLARLFRGNVAPRLLRTAPLPVLVVPSKWLKRNRAVGANIASDAVQSHV